MANINIGTPRAMVAVDPGVRPSLDSKDKSFLKEGGLFINLPDNILCVGIEGGGYIEFRLTRVGVVI